MTMQVGMVGTDGVILASDTLWVGGGGGARHTYHSSKIVVEPERGIAVGCARSDISRIVADQIIEDLGNFEHPCFEMKAIAKKIMETTSNEPEAQCLVVLRKPPAIRLFALDMVPLSRNCCEITDKTFAGDTQNSAKFFAERYYTRRPVKELILLAAHVVLAAAKLPGGMISGLEILLCDASGFSRVSAATLQELENKSAAMDSSMVMRLFGEEADCHPGAAGLSPLV